MPRSTGTGAYFVTNFSVASGHDSLILIVVLHNTRACPGPRFLWGARSPSFDSPAFAVAGFFIRGSLLF